MRAKDLDIPLPGNEKDLMLSENYSLFRKICLMLYPVNKS